MYFDLETIFELNFEEPGYLEAKEYDNELNEKIVQLGMALAYSEKKINTTGIEAIKNWINFEVLYKIKVPEKEFCIKLVCNKN